MGKWFQPGTRVKGISGYAHTYDLEGVVVRGRDKNGLYIVRWDSGEVQTLTIHEIASLKFEVKE